VIENAMVDSEGYANKEGSDRLSCIFNKVCLCFAAHLYLALEIVASRIVGLFS
jgi:hypothetical protein